MFNSSFNINAFLNMIYVYYISFFANWKVFYSCKSSQSA